MNPTNLSDLTNLRGEFKEMLLKKCTTFLQRPHFAQEMCVEAIDFFVWGGGGVGDTGH